MTDKVIKPEHNTMNGKNAWDTMMEIAEANPMFDKKDVVFLTLMLKHIPRAGRKSYGENSTKVEDKILDLKKSAVYLNAWIEMLEGMDAKEKAKTLEDNKTKNIYSFYKDGELTEDILDITGYISNYLNGSITSIEDKCICIIERFGEYTSLIPKPFGKVNMLRYYVSDSIDEHGSIITYLIKFDNDLFEYKVNFSLDRDANIISIFKATLCFLRKEN